jgi:hypothetical protein
MPTSNIPQVVHLLLDALHGLGYNQAADALTQQSGLQSHTPAVAELRVRELLLCNSSSQTSLPSPQEAVLAGRWEDVITRLRASTPPLGPARGEAALVLVAVLHQAYLESLEAGKGAAAINVSD